MRRAASGARRLAARVIYETGTALGRYEWVAVPVARWRGHGVPVGPRTDVVIEGYPRSGNTFAVAAVTSAQPGRLLIAHHLHAPGNVLAGVRRGLPTLVLIDRPRSAVVEFAAGKPDITVGQALRGWIRFYAPLVRVRRRVVVATADEVRSDMGAVVRRVNDRFGTGLRGFDGTEDAMQRARDGMEAYVRARAGPGLPLVGRSGGAAPPVEAERDRAGRAYDSPRLASLRGRAARLHETFTGTLG